MKKIVRRRRRWWLATLLILVLIGGYGTWALRRPLPAIPPVQTSAVEQAKAADGTLAWPAAGQSAAGIAGSPILQTHDPQTSLPTASTAKLITALSVLRQKPLDTNQQGPLITLGSSDVALYNSYATKQGSVVKVVAGEQISEYQMLQAILLPSANNMADSLAIWAFGSLNAYTSYANSYVSQLGLNATHIGSDASGFAPDTTSSAHDLVKLGEIAMQDPVLAQIVGQPAASGLPIVNNVKNVNSLLGTGNIIGVKTGNTDQAGGVFVAAARTTVNNKQVTVVTAVLGSPNLFTAMKDSLALIQSAQDNFKPVTVVTAGTVAGSYKLPWGGSVQAIADQDLGLDTWAGSKVTAKTKLQSISISSSAGQIVGSLTVQKSALTGQKSVAIKLMNGPAKPSISWRLLHPLP
jgi:D-alanyl-D-alanine carboxypeptidase (penicillin-binding protein 5/6)